MTLSIDDAVIVRFVTPRSAAYSPETTSALRYLLDRRFDIFGLAVAVGNGSTQFFHKDAGPGGTVDDGVAVVRAELATGKTLCCHDASFTGLVLGVRFGVEASRIFDVQDYANAIRIGPSLENLALHVGKRRLPTPPLPTAPRGERRRGSMSAGGVPSTFESSVMPFAGPQTTRRVHDDEFEVMSITARQNLDGVRIDTGRLAHVRSDLHRAATEAEAELAASFPDFTAESVNDLRGVRAYLERTCGESPSSLKKNGDELPQFLVAHPAAVPFVRLWQIVRTLKLAHSRLPRELGDRLCSPIRYHAAHTGRFTGGGDQCDNFNLQGLPKSSGTAHEAIGGIRTIIIPEDGEFFVAADLSAIEARVIATLADEGILLDRFRNGDDLYVWLALQMFPGLPIAKDGPNAHLRQLCKAAVLGIGFGMGFDRFRLDILRKMPDTDPNHIRNVYDQFKAMTPRITSLREQLWSAFEDALHTGRPVRAGRCTFLSTETDDDRGATVTIELPSGRFLFYRDIQCAEGLDRYGNLRTRYWYADGYEFEVGEHRGKKGLRSRLCTDGRYRDPVNAIAIAENIVQASARDILVHQMLSLSEDSLLRPVFHVHDELVCACSPCTCGLSDWAPPVRHGTGCPWAAAATRLVTVMSQVPPSLPELGDVPLAAELSKNVWETYAG